jgi:hypothetical protein
MTRELRVMLGVMGFIVVVALLVLLTGCGETSYDREQREYEQCVDAGGNWVQIGEGHWTCEHEETRQE